MLVLLRQSRAAQDDSTLQAWLPVLLHKGQAVTMVMDMHEKMWACKHHREGYLEDTCLYEDETYSFDDPDHAFYLWLECKKCRHFEPKRNGTAEKDV